LESVVGIALLVVVVRVRCRIQLSESVEGIDASLFLLGQISCLLFGLLSVSLSLSLCVSESVFGIGFGFKTRFVGVLVVGDRWGSVVVANHISCWNQWLVYY